MKRSLARATVPVTVVALLACTAAAPAAPRLGRTAVLNPTGGSVLVKGKGARRFVRVDHRVTIRMGTTVDVSHGRAHLTTAKNSRGGTQSGMFRDGAFVVRQRRGRPLTTLRLVDGATKSCVGAPRGSATGVFAQGARRTRGGLFGRAHGHFRSRGRNSSATIRGTTWVTEDLCNGSTRVRAIAGGGVQKKSRSDTALLEPGQTSEDYCDFEPGPPVTSVADYYCVGVTYGPFGPPLKGDLVAFVLLVGHLDGPHPATLADACVQPEGDPVHCTTYRVEDPSDVAIVADACGLPAGRRAYTLQWRIGDVSFAPPMDVFSTSSEVDVPPSCTKRPTFPPFDAPVDEPGNEYEP